MEWIKVRDKLPEYKTELIFLNGKKEVTVGTSFAIEDENRVWIHDKLRNSNEIATHWMELPGAPKD